MDAQLKRGILNICVLKLLENESMYGYELVKTIQQYFRDTEESTRSEEHTSELQSP